MCVLLTQQPTFTTKLFITCTSQPPKLTVPVISAYQRPLSTLAAPIKPLLKFTRLFSSIRTSTRILAHTKTTLPSKEPATKTTQG